MMMYPLKLRLFLQGVLVLLCLVQSMGYSLADPAPPATQPTVYQGQVSVTEMLQKRYPTANYKDMVQVPKNHKLEIRIASMLSDGVSQAGDEFYGKLTSDYSVDGKLLLPRGTIVHGVLKDITQAKRAGRAGYLTMTFDYLITPDGREVEIAGNSTTKDNAVVSGAKVATRAMGITALGGVVGAVTVLKLGGLVLNAASQGYALAGGAALGAAGGLAYALATKGEAALLQPGAELQISLSDSLKLPSVTPVNETDLQQTLPGLDVTILGTQLRRNPFNEPTELNVSLNLVNRTEESFSMFDFALMDEHQQLYYATPFGERSLMYSRLKPHTNLRGELTFDIEDPTTKHYLVVLKGYNRSVVAKFPLGEPVDARKKKRSVSGA